jgi:hypothetical protein
MPEPWLPPGLELDSLEGTGEVQTPVRGEAARTLRIGDRVYLRHAKAGELCERFDRLYERSMRASESGDTATVERFAPMALLAYAQLDSIDADARYHAALLRLHTGDISGAAALGDSILAITPGHLFGYVVQATVGRWRHDEPATKAAYAGFLSHYDAEVRVARPEYAAHKMIMDDMHQRAQAAAKGL